MRAAPTRKLLLSDLNTDLAHTFNEEDNHRRSQVQPCTPGGPQRQQEMVRLRKQHGKIRARPHTSRGISEHMDDLSKNHNF